MKSEGQTLEKNIYEPMRIVASLCLPNYSFLFFQEILGFIASSLVFFTILVLFYSSKKVVNFYYKNTVMYYYYFLSSALMLLPNLVFMDTTTHWPVLCLIIVPLIYLRKTNNLLGNRS